MTPVESLKHDLSSEMEIEQLFQKHIIDGSSYYFREVLSDRNKEYELRHALANLLDLSINDATIVGSGKLGFSVKNEKFLRFDERFAQTRIPKHKSDIDIAIVSRKLFDQQAALIFNMSRHFSSDWANQNWQFNYYYSDQISLNKYGIDSLFNFYAKNIARGWLRQDYTPNQYINAIPWKQVQDEWFTKIKRKISIAIYSDWNYLKHYQMDNFLNLRQKTQNLEILNG